MRAPSGERLSERVALGALTATFPRALIDEVVEATGRREQRSRLLPARVTVYYVLAMTLFPSAGYPPISSPPMTPISSNNATVNSLRTRQ